MNWTLVDEDRVQWRALADFCDNVFHKVFFTSCAASTDVSKTFIACAPLYNVS
jgi:hypothetical protein